MEVVLILMILVTALMSLATAAAEPALSPESWDPVNNQNDLHANWTFSSGPEFPGARGEVRFSNEASCGELVYDFSSGGNYVAATIDGPSREVSAIRVSLHNPHGNRLTFRYTDSAWTTFQKSVNAPPIGWQDYEIRISPDAAQWGGPGDGQLRPPIVQFGILVENSGQSPKGSLLFRDLALISGQAAGDLVKAAFPLTDFKSGWSVSGEAALQDGTLSYALSERQPIVRIHCDSLSMPGRPTALRLTLDSDGSGHEIVARCASHFQLFERVIGTLDAIGSMTFEAPLKGMTEWVHFGGEDDGIVRHPLRLIELALRKKGEASSGRIGFRSLLIETESEPSKSVDLIPKAALAGDGDLKLQITVRSMSANIEGTLGIVLVDSRGGAFWRTGIPVAFTGCGDHEVPAMDLNIGGRGFAEVRCALLTDSGLSFSSSTTVGRQPEPVPVEPSRPSPFGMGLYLYRYSPTPEGYADMDAAASAAARAGVVWSREEFGWSRIMPERGRYEWDYYDRMVETASRHGIRIYGLISYWSAWTQPYTSEGIADYCAYSKALVTRYKDHIKHWEVWNEPNIFFWPGPKPVYSKLLTEAYNAIKEADPEAQVLGCSTSGIDMPFIQDVIARGGLFDILTIHPYRGGLHDESFIRELHNTRDMVQKPVWITEMGWPTEIGGVSERRQASLVSRVYIDSAASGAVGNVSWYDFRNDGVDPFYNEYNFGVVRRDLSPKAGYLALAAAIRRLTPFSNQPATQLPDLPEGILGYRFASGTDRLAVVWSTSGTRIISLRTEGKVSAITDFVGGSVAPIKHRDSLLIALLPDEPVFLSGDGFEITEVSVPVQWSVTPGNPRAGDTVSVSIEALGAFPQFQITAPGCTSRGRTLTTRLPEHQGHNPFTLCVTLQTRHFSVTLPIEIPASPPVLIV